MIKSYNRITNSGHVRAEVKNSKRFVSFQKQTALAFTNNMFKLFLNSYEQAGTFQSIAYQHRATKNMVYKISLKIFN